MWSSQAARRAGASTIWLVPASSPGLKVESPFDGLGLRGNDSSPVTAEDVEIPTAAMLGADGQGFEIMMSVVLPAFAVLNAACSNGLMAGAIRRTVEHVTNTRHGRHGHLAGRPSDHPKLRRPHAGQGGSFRGAAVGDTLAAIAGSRADAMLRVLECKAAAAESRRRSARYRDARLRRRWRSAKTSAWSASSAMRGRRRDGADHRRRSTISSARPFADMPLF